MNTHPQSLRVLFLEDVPSDAELAMRLLRRAGISCEERVIETRQDMLRELDVFGPDIILSDYTMPQFSGLEALEIRNQRAPDLPFVMVTVSIDEQTAVECIKRGADDYVNKDHLARLPRAVRAALEKKRLQLAEREAQDELKRTTQEWRATFDAVRDGVALLDVDRKILRCNNAFREIVGKPLDDIIGQAVHRVVHGFDQPPTQCPALRASRSLRRETWQIPVNDRWLDLVADPILGEDGRLTGIVHIVADITERKQAEEALRESEEKYRLLFESSHDPIMTLAPPSWKYTSGNASAIRLFRACDENDFISRAPWEYSPERQADGILSYEKAGEMIDTAMRDGSHFFEWRHKRLDGEEFPATVLLTRFELNGRTLLQATVRDISESMRLEAEREKLRDQLLHAQKMESIGRLAGGVAHDLNNLLSPILGYSEMLLEDLGKHDVRRESVGEILRAGIRARDLVRQLLAFSRKQTLEFKSVNINQTIEGFEKLLRRTIPEDIGIQVISSPEIPAVMADVGQIEQVIMNLAVNAADAMPGGGKLTIETAVTDLDEAYAATHPDVEPGRYVRLAFSDTGCGMDAETRRRIFEPFFSTKGERGTGLGLATVYGIVKQHGGNIWIYSEPGNGTTFKIYLPVAEKADIGESTGKKTTTDLRGSETVLLVEDEEQVRVLANAILTRQGYAVLVAKHSAEALLVLEGHNGAVNLLLTDVVMPGMNGRELYNRCVEKHPDLKVLYMSGYTDNVIAHRGVLEEGVHFIQKPFSVQTLASKVREALERD
ncbi:MAG: response regulator [Deltaproteobacteria bacterium]|nr:response regulator [Deltaproteobacteria bacterium]